MSKHPEAPGRVELTRRAFQAGVAGDIDAATRHLAADAVWDVPSISGRFEGVTAIREFLEDWLGSFDGYEAELEEVRECDRRTVLVIAREAASPVGGSAWARIREHVGYLVTWEGDEISHVTIYADTDEARAAAARLSGE